MTERFTIDDWLMYDDGEHINTRQAVKLLNKLFEENEQLKCENKNLKGILNDFINICNRLQANPNDKLALNVAKDMLQNMGVEI